MRRFSLSARVLLPTAMVVLSGCYSLFGGRPGQSGLSRKHVARKEPPTSLIAIDNTRCLVTEQKYRDTPVGADVMCYWTSDHQDRVVTAGTQSNTVPQPEASGKVSEMLGRSGAAATPRVRKPND
jgi:hypothetical protein